MTYLLIQMYFECREVGREKVDMIHGLRHGNLIKYFSNTLYIE